MGKNSAEKIKITSFNDLFGIPDDNTEKTLNDGDGIKDIKNHIHNIPIEKLHEYPGHYFKRPVDEEWESFVESIKQQGILQPIIVRQHPEYENEYQIIAGHCRTAAAREIGLHEVPSIVIEAEDEIEASVLVGITNKQREHISDIEWGRTYRETYELMKRSAGRPKGNMFHDEHNYETRNGAHDEHNYETRNGAHDEHNYETGNGAHDEHNYETGNGAHDEHNYETGNGAHDEHNLKGVKTLDLIAEKYGVSRAVIQRKIRLSYLIPELAELYEIKKIIQAVAVDLSYLSDKEQEDVNKFLQKSSIKITPAVSKLLKAESEKRKKEGTSEISFEELYNLLATEKIIKYKPKVKLSNSVRKKYFPSSYDEKDIEEVISKLLDNWAQEHNPEYDK